MSMLKVDKELREAVDKHGEIVPPKDHIEEFYEKIKDRKKELATGI